MAGERGVCHALSETAVSFEKMLAHISVGHSEKSTAWRVSAAQRKLAVIYMLFVDAMQDYELQSILRSESRLALQLHALYGEGTSAYRWPSSVTRKCSSAAGVP